MPNLSQELIEKLNLQPGDIIISEFPFDDATVKDYPARNPLKDFVPNHVSIFTGQFERPFAHAVREGHKLPGLRLTKQWDGRHIVYRFPHKDIAALAATIARRWAISIDIYDLMRFERTYPSVAWGKAYDKYKHEYFSTPGAQIAGPATPYDLDRANVQVSERARNVNLIEFTDKSLLRAAKFASRSEVSQRISKGLRCTSFAIGVYQAAMLHAIVKKTVCKFPFKALNSLEFNQALNAILIDDWQNTTLGEKILQMHENKSYVGIFGDALTLDLKYAVPFDLNHRLTRSNEWFTAGYFAIFDSKLLHYANYCASPPSSPKPVVFSPPLQVRSAPPSPTHRKAVDEQEHFAADVANRLTTHGTPPRNANGSSPRLERTKSVDRMLFQ